MSKRDLKDKQNRPDAGSEQSMSSRLLGALLFAAVIAGILWGFQQYSKSRKSREAAVTPAGQSSLAAAPGFSNAPSSAARETVLKPAGDLSTMEINHAVMVTVELDLGSPMPPIAEALNYIERRSKPDDGQGRTFAILDAYGGPTADNKKLHISMHVSTEKPGLASLVFSKTGEVLWQTKIVQGTNPAPAFSGKNLTILIDTGAGDGRTWMLDGSAGPSSVMDAIVKELGQPLRDVWPDGTEREMTFIYSACGCPVKVMVRRNGDRTVRTKEIPVIFPDDPAVVSVISKLMRW